MGNINKTVKSKYPPKQKNVNWIDTSGNKPVIKVFNNGKWQKLSGSGAGVKIPIPTAEDEGKILVVTETEGNTFTIVPEQSVPANNETPLTGVDLAKFVVGNTVKVTITPEENDDDTPVPGHLPDYSGPVSESEPASELEQGDSPGTTIPIIHKPTISQTITATGVIEEHGEVAGVSFDNTVYNFIVVQRDNLLYTDAVYAFDSNVTIKLEYIESNYEYQLQENSGSSGSITVDPNNPPTELEPNTIYNYGTLNDDTTFPQLKESETDGNVYCWFFWTSSPVPEINVLKSLIWANGTEPVWSANKYYEITVMNNIATCLEV